MDIFFCHRVETGPGAHRVYRPVGTVGELSAEVKCLELKPRHIIHSYGVVNS